MQKEVFGRVHSYETFGAVDGPGVRFVLFLQGCPLRCLYCHNPDACAANGGKLASAREVVDLINRYKNFIKDGGVTISGGEPLYQYKFVYEILRLCKNKGFHTAIDTSGYADLEKVKEVLNIVDLVLLDIKDIDDDDARILTGQGIERAKLMLEYLNGIKKGVWIRHVLIPNYTLKEDKLKRLSSFCKGYECIQRVELLAFHKMGEYKYNELNLDYKLKDIPAPTQEQMEEARRIFREGGLKAV